MASSLTVLFVGVIILTSRHPNAEDSQFSVGEVNPSKMQPITPHAFRGVDSHAAQHVLYLRAPAAQKIGEPLRPNVGIDPFGKSKVAGTDAPGTLPDMTLLRPGTGYSEPRLVRR